MLALLGLVGLGSVVLTLENFRLGTPGLSGVPMFFGWARSEGGVVK